MSGLLSRKKGTCYWKGLQNKLHLKEMWSHGHKRFRKPQLSSQMRHYQMIRLIYSPSQWKNMCVCVGGCLLENIYLYKKSTLLLKKNSNSNCITVHSTLNYLILLGNEKNYKWVLGPVRRIDGDNKLNTDHSLGTESPWTKRLRETTNFKVGTQPEERNNGYGDNKKLMVDSYCAYLYPSPYLATELIRGFWPI